MRAAQSRPTDSGDRWTAAHAGTSRRALSEAIDIIRAISVGDLKPRDIRRLLNIQGAFTSASHGLLQGPLEQRVEQLLPLVLDLGVSAFILMADDAATIELWGSEVAPALRDAVARERQPRK